MANKRPLDTPKPTYIARNWDLADAIKASGLYDVAIAREFGASLSTVRRWRRGEGAPGDHLKAEVIKWLRAQAKPPEPDAEYKHAVMRVFEAAMPERVRTEDFIHLLEVVEASEKTARELDALHVELALEAPVAPLSRDNARFLIEDLRRTIARQLGGPPCTQCGGRGSWPKLTRQLCSHCKGKRVEPGQ